MYFDVVAFAIVSRIPDRLRSLSAYEPTIDMDIGGLDGTGTEKSVFSL